jgi:hypothetical protein
MVGDIVVGDMGFGWCWGWRRGGFGEQVIAGTSVGEWWGWRLGGCAESVVVWFVW